MARRLDLRFSPLEILNALSRREPDLYAVVRMQSTIGRRAGYAGHMPSQISENAIEGMGVQLYAPGGRSVLVASDVIDRPTLERLIAQAIALLASHPEVPDGLDTGAFKGYSPIRARRFHAGRDVVADLSLAEFAREVERAHEYFYTLADDTCRTMATNALAFDEQWRIFRSDGTDVYFQTIRTTLSHQVTLTRDGRTTTVRDAESGCDDTLLTDPASLDRMRRRIHRKMVLGLQTLSAEPVPAGHYNIILDAGMAKGLAHEAFGHACESDRVMEGSALTRDGTYLRGERIAPPSVSVVDCALEGDWADQPFSANGFPRQRVAIIDRGILTNALGDIFSGPAAGLESTGAERVERYDRPPLPRMSNIRLEVADAIPWDRDFALVEADELYRFLLDRGVIRLDEEWLFLEGYRGGQVNSMSGDYVFNCSVIHRLRDGEVHVHPPAIFSGRVLETLNAIRAAVGPLEIHRQGTCGKDGQRVPSSGGGHLFTLFNACEGISIGGR